MTKNKQWSLYLWQPHKNYPSKIYVWINPDNIVSYSREILPLGFMPTLNTDNLIGLTLNELKEVPNNINNNNNVDRNLNTEIIRKQTKMTQEQLSQGMLLF